MRKSISNTFTVNAIEDGTSPYFADLDNGMDSVACDYQGVTTSEQFVETNVCMFFGNQKQVIPVSGGIVCKIGNTTLGSSYRASGVGYNYKVEVTNLGTTSAHIKLFVRDNTEIDSTTVTITVSVVGENGNVSANLDFVINGVRAGKNGDAAVIYNLFPSSSEVVVARTGDGGYNPRYNTLRCGYKKSVGDSPIIVPDATSTIDGLYRVFFRRRKRSDGAWETDDRNRTVYYFYGDNVYSHYLIPNSATSGLDALTYDMVEFVLYKDTSSSILYSLVQSNVVDKEIVGIVSDGQSAPSYPKEYYAWSNVESTVDATTSPFEEPYAGWSESIPQQGSYAYLWKKIVKYTYNDTTGQYDQEPAQYFRMSGTNGTSINVKGTIDYAYNSSGVFPPPTSSLNGRKAIAKEDNKIWVCQQVQPNQYAWTPSGNTASDGFSYTVVQGNFNGNYQSISVLTGHLVMWSNAANDWIDLGKFKGENGTTYYTHYAWATDVVFAAGTLPIPAGQTNRPNSTSVTGGSLEPSEDGSKPYMGILIDTKVSASTVYENYTWSYAKGDKGDIGKVGRFFYYAGDWNASDNSKTFLINDATTPFFSKAGSNSDDYYVFNKFYDDSQNHYLTMKGMADASEKVSGKIDWTKAPWKVMTDDFKYLITEAIFADFAKLGSFIISGDWLFSQFGVLYDTNGTARVIDSKNIAYIIGGNTYNYNNAYLKFDAQYPNSSKPNDINFCPFLADDGLTGVTYRQRGNIGGFVINSTQIKSTNENIVLNSDGSATLENCNVKGVISASLMYGTQLTVNNPNTSVRKYTMDLTNYPANLFMCSPTFGNLVIVLPVAGDYDGMTIRFFADGVTGDKTVTLQTYNSGVELYFKDMDNYVVGSWQHSNAMKMLNNEPYEASAINGVWYITQGIGKYGEYVS